MIPMLGRDPDHSWSGRIEADTLEGLLKGFVEPQPCHLFLLKRLLI